MNGFMSVLVSVIVLTLMILLQETARGEAAGMASQGEAPPGEVRLSWNPEAPSQGDVVRLEVELPAGVQITRGTLEGQPIHFVPPSDSRQGWTAWAGVDAEHEPGSWEVRVWGQPREAGPGFVLESRIPIRAKDFGKEELTLPDSKVRLSEEALQRVRRENQTIAALWPRVTPERLWEGEFLTPVDGNPGSPFGVRRWINREPRSFHTGYDIKAPSGTPVLAANRGRVILVGDFFFGGRSVFVDHGLGLYTMYFHLSEILVEPDQEVGKGEVLGRVGSTGRATGPHLHWGVRLGGARVDPVALLRATQEASEMTDEREDETGG